MSATSFEEKLKDLNLTNDELKKFSNAFKNDEFRKLFIEYAEELNDPKNRELYEKEIRAVEEQRGSDVTFVHPNPGHVVKTTVNGQQKCFINIATNEHVEKPSFAKTDAPNGKQGAHWSLPHCLAGPHDDIDHESNSCTVYDVIFSPDTYRMGETNAKFMSMIEESALDSVEKNYQCQLDRNNVKRLKMKFKGVAKATIIRKKMANGPVTDADTLSKSETDDKIDNALAAAQNHKVVLSSHNRSANHVPPSTDVKPSQPAALPTDENGFTVPTYRLIHRGQFDMQDCTNAISSQVHSMRPKELFVEIDLPLCSSSNNVDLDVYERSLKLHCDAPKYCLDLTLPYPVRESDSHARFDKKQRKLLVTLAVIKESPTMIELSSPVDMDQTLEETRETSPTTNNQTVPSMDTSSAVSYSAIPFEYKQGLAHMALVLHIKNVDKTTFTIDNDGQHITIRLSSFGSGYYPLLHQLCLDFDESSVFDTADDSTTLTFNEDNILVLLKKTLNHHQLTQFSSGTNRDDMKINPMTASIPIDKPNATSAMTKEDFLVEKSGSSTSPASDPAQKLTKKQARKRARENRKNQADNVSTEHDDDKVARKIAEVTLQTEASNRKQSVEIGIPDEKRPNAAAHVNSHPSIYRRHLSESHADLDNSSNGEFKLKGILKKSTKSRSYSESFSEPCNGDFLPDESVFGPYSANDDLTSSNDNNSMVTSPDSIGGGDSGNLFTRSTSSSSVKHVTFNNQVSRKTFKPGGPVSGMKKLTTNQQRKLKKRRRKDSLNSQSSDQDEGTPGETTLAKVPSTASDEYRNPVDMQDVISWQASGSQASHMETNGESSANKSAVRFTNPLIFELEN